MMMPKYKQNYGNPVSGRAKEAGVRMAVTATGAGNLSHSLLDNV